MKLWKVTLYEEIAHVFGRRSIGTSFGRWGISSLWLLTPQLCYNSAEAAIDSMSTNELVYVPVRLYLRKQAQPALGLWPVLCWFLSSWTLHSGGRTEAINKLQLKTDSSRKAWLWEWLFFFLNKDVKLVREFYLGEHSRKGTEGTKALKWGESEGWSGSSGKTPEVF